VAVIIMLLIASITVAGLFLAAFIWSVKKGQFDDQYSPPRRILFDDTPADDTPTT
jgi:cbb3-type cytochrome oxidase maturation protein